MNLTAVLMVSEAVARTFKVKVSYGVRSANVEGLMRSTPCVFDQPLLAGMYRPDICKDVGYHPHHCISASESTNQAAPRDRIEAGGDTPKASTCYVQTQAICHPSSRCAFIR